MDSVTFFIGSEHTQVTLPRAVIEKDTFLERYLSFNGKKITYISPEGLQGFVLKEEDSDFLKIFLRFLLGGDFEWNEEIAQYFDYMGYPNLQGYPLDYWKIKLHDNWIRNNFYRLELWNEALNDRNDLLIERGPYVGLVDITPNHTGFVTFEPSFSPEKLNNVFNLESSPVILAGGSLSSILIGAHHQSDDLDFFITTKDEETAEEEIIRLISSYRTITEDTSRLEGPGKITRTENAITIGILKPKWQVILRLYTCPSEVVHGFDLDASGFLFDGKRIWATHRARYSLFNRVNFFDPDRMSPTYAYRLAKYASRGYRVWLPNFNEKQINYHSLRKIKYSIDMNYEIDKDSIFTYAPQYLPNFRDLEAIRENKYFKDFVEKRNPIDMIIFASYYRYIPKLMKSDYETVKTSLKTKNFRKDNEVSSGWWEMAGSGYVTFSSKGEISTQAVLNLNPDLVKVSGLSSTLKWKSQNPMEQVSGTFNPDKISDINSWYIGSDFYISIPKLNRRIY